MTAHQGALYERRLFVQKGTGVQFPAVAGATGMRLGHADQASVCHGVQPVEDALLGDAHFLGQLSAAPGAV